MARRGATLCAGAVGLGGQCVRRRRGGRLDLLALLLAPRGSGEMARPAVRRDAGGTLPQPHRFFPAALSGGDPCVSPTARRIARHAQGNRPPAARFPPGAVHAGRRDLPPRAADRPFATRCHPGAPSRRPSPARFPSGRRASDVGPHRRWPGQQRRCGLPHSRTVGSATRFLLAGSARAPSSGFGVPLRWALALQASARRGVGADGGAAVPGSGRGPAQALHGLGRPELTVLPAELAGVLLLVEPSHGDGRAQAEETTRALVAHTRSSVSTAATRRRAAWLLALLARRWGGGPSDSAAYLRLLDGERGRQPLTTLLAADAAARQDRPLAALQLTDALTSLQADSLGDPEVVDPFFRTLLHLFRADWYVRRQDRDGAERELRWYQNNDVFGRPSGPPQVADVDWGFSTLARWRLAQLLDGADDSRACDLYREVRRDWADGEALYRARADSAAARTAALQCPPRA